MKRSVQVHLCVCVPDCSGAERRRGAGGDVRVVLGVKLIINSILHENKENTTDLCQQHVLSSRVLTLCVTSLSNHGCLHQGGPLEN